MHRTASALVAVGLLLAACEGSSDVGLDPPTDETTADEAGTDQSPAPGGQQSPTTPAEASPGDGAGVAPGPSPSMAADIDVTTTPDEVTPEWVTAVVNTLLAEYGEMTAEILAMPVREDPTLPAGFEERLDALFDGEYLERRRQTLRNILTNQDGIRADLLPSDQYRGLRFEADVVQFAEDSCIIAVGHISRHLTVPNGEAAGGLSAVSLVPGLGSTNWVVVDELANIAPDGSENPDEVMLEATLGDYGVALEHQCSGAS